MFRIARAMLKLDVSNEAAIVQSDMEKKRNQMACANTSA
jgi:hypothetical protein